MQEDSAHPSSSHARILKTVTSQPAVAFSEQSVENPLPPTALQHYMDVEEGRPDMVTCFRRLFMAEQFPETNGSTQQAQDQSSVRNTRF